MKLKVNPLILNIYVLIFFTYIVNNYIRSVISYKLYEINIFLVIVILICILFYKKRINNIIFFNSIFIILTTLTNNIFCNKNLLTIISVITSLGLPLFLLGLKLNNIEFEKIYLRFIKLYNGLIIILVIIGVLDKITNYFPANFVANLFNVSSFKSLVIAQTHSSTYRYFSFMGHPLFNAQLILIYYSLNYINNIYFDNKRNEVFYKLISIVGIALTGSKSALVLIIFAIITLNNFEIKIIKLLLPLLLIVLAFSTGIFDETVNRFLTESSLTSGRNETLKTLMNANVLEFHFFHGKGNEYAYTLGLFFNKASAAFEYPILNFILEYGILATLVLYSTIFIFPLVTFIINHTYKLIIPFLVVFVFVNLYNGITLKGDVMLNYCFFIFIMINISYYKKNSRRQEVVR